MAEAVFTLGIFAVPILAVAVIEQRKMELKRRKRELASLREIERFKHFKQGMAYRDECMKQRVLNTERQQVDKEEKRYAINEGIGRENIIDQIVYITGKTRQFYQAMSLYELETELIIVKMQEGL